MNWFKNTGLNQIDLLLLFARLSIKTVAAGLIFTLPINLSHQIIFGVIIFASELYEWPATQIGQQNHRLKPIVHTITGIANLTMAFAILLVLNQLPQSGYLFALLFVLFAGVSGGINSGLSTGLVGGFLYLIISILFTSTPQGLTVFRGLNFFLFGSLAGLAGDIYLQQIKRNSTLITDHQQIYQAETLKNEFVSITAHNLRSPITIIRGYLQVMLEEEIDSTGYQTALARVAEKTKQLEEEANRLVRITLLDANEVELNLTEQSIEPLLNQLEEKYTTIATDKQLRFDYTNHLSGEQVVRHDPLQLKSALESILDNAFKYNRTGKFVKLDVTTTPDDNTIKFTISDDGGGIPTDVLPHLFEKYTRSRQHQAITGSGLGLYLTRKIIDAHHGTVNAQNIDHQAQFVVKIPLG